MFYYWWDWTWLILLPAIALSLIAQARVSAAYNRYSRVATRGGRTASDVVAEMFAREGIENVRIEPTRGRMTDHYDPKALALRLSEGVYNSSSIAALGIAAHEAGHALQHRDGYAPLMLRTASVFAVNIGSNLSWPLVILGLLFSFEPLILAGIFLFSLVVLFSLITLPVEFNASRRAPGAGRRRLSRGGRTHWRAQGAIRRGAHLCGQRADRHLAAGAAAGDFRRGPQARLTQETEENAYGTTCMAQRPQLWRAGRRPGGRRACPPARAGSVRRPPIFARRNL